MPKLDCCAGRLFGQLVDMLRFYMAFPIADLRLEPLSDEDVQAAHAQRVQAFQRLLFKHHPPLRYRCSGIGALKQIACRHRLLHGTVHASRLGVPGVKV